jgi:hypothetical protein
MSSNWNLFKENEMSNPITITLQINGLEQVQVTGVPASEPAVVTPAAILQQVESEDKALDEHDMATTAIHVSIGFYTKVMPGSPSTVFDWIDGSLSDRLGGQIGASSACADLAQDLTGAVNALASHYRAIGHEVLDYPGVFDYEVSETLGSRLREAREAAVELHPLLVAVAVASFFKGGNRGPKPGFDDVNPDMSFVQMREVVVDYLNKMGVA